MAIMLSVMPSLTMAEGLVMSLSTQRIAITSNYTGSDTVVFGSIVRDDQTAPRGDGYDLIVVVRGPPRSHVVREKEQFGPVWINSQQRKFTDVPSYIAVLSNRPVTSIAGPQVRSRRQLGLAVSVEPSANEILPDPWDNRFRDALVRLKGEAGLFREEPQGVAFLTENLFRAPVVIPATAPTGFYKVEVYLFSGGALLASEFSGFELVKIGFEQQMASLAERAPWFYGLATVALALGAGWMASIAFRRD